MDVLPLGFRFSSRDEELIDHYLWSKIIGLEEAVGVIREIDIYNFEPWDLPDFSVMVPDDDEWFFFCPKDRKYQNGERMNRATAGGYWKATGKDRTIKSVGGKIVIGTKKCFVFYAGRAPLGQRTNWIMYEYSVASKELDDGIGQGSFVLCKVIKKHDEKFGGMQDENSESSVGNEIEESASSPAPIGSFAEDM